MSQSAPVQPRPSGTVVLLRDVEEALEVLLLQRASRKGPGQGAWVFPGGKVDAEDAQAPNEAPELLARRAAVRETQEEAGLHLEIAGLVPISRWITPEMAKRRFDTWFFSAALDTEVDVRVDGVEIHDHRWLRPGHALELHQAGRLRLPPPTYVTISWLTEQSTAARALAALAAAPFTVFRPRLCAVPDGGCMLYPGDAGYEDRDPDRPGSRNRLWTLPDGFRYERRPH